jgi:3-oxoadipate enol-lactonase
VTDVSLPDGGRIAATDRGRGAPLLLLRPLGGSVASWEPFDDLLSSHVRVVAFDPRGSGCSSAAPIGVTTRGMAGDAIAVLDAFGIERAHVYGVSLGGMVASWLSVDAPERVARLVLASTLRVGTEVEPAWRRVGGLARCLARPPRRAAACLAAQVLSRRFRAKHPDEVNRIRRRARARPASYRGMLALFLAAARHDVRARIRDIAAPTLVLAGERDELVPSAVQRDFAASLPNARFLVIPDAGHDVSAEAPAAVADAILTHLDAT